MPLQMKQQPLKYPQFNSYSVWNKPKFLSFPSFLPLSIPSFLPFFAPFSFFLLKMNIFFETILVDCMCGWVLFFSFYFFLFLFLFVCFGGDRGSSGTDMSCKSSTSKCILKHILQQFLLLCSFASTIASCFQYFCLMRSKAI